MVPVVDDENEEDTDALADDVTSVTVDPSELDMLRDRRSSLGDCDRDCVWECDGDVDAEAPLRENDCDDFDCVKLWEFLLAVTLKDAVRLAAAERLSEAIDAVKVVLCDGMSERVDDTEPVKVRVGDELSDKALDGDTVTDSVDVTVGDALADFDGGCVLVLTLIASSACNARKMTIMKIIALQWREEFVSEEQPLVPKKGLFNFISKKYRGNVCGRRCAFSNFLILL
jgi:hypothetical protein